MLLSHFLISKYSDNNCSTDVLTVGAARVTITAHMPSNMKLQHAENISQECHFTQMFRRACFIPSLLRSALENRYMALQCSLNRLFITDTVKFTIFICGLSTTNFIHCKIRYTHIKINPSQIAEVIGKGGAVIKSIVEETGAVIDISDDGVVKIAATDQSKSDHAKSIIEDITAGPQINKIYEGKVAKIMDFGAFVNISPNRDGLVHISQICLLYTSDAADE